MQKDPQSSPSNVAASSATPEGYLRFSVDGKEVIAREWAVQPVREALRFGTLHEWAAAQSVQDRMHGRGISYGVNLPAGKGPDESTPVVVRRNRHGGVLRFLTGEHFLLPTRAPLELATALRLAAAGIPTPEVIACAVYPVAGVFARSDVMTRRLPSGADFPEVWRDAGPELRHALLDSVALLLRALAGAGAWHADLNLKNIYIASDGGKPQAYLLDVDRVTFPGTPDVANRNLERLARSARKWRDRRGLEICENALARLAALALENY